MALFPLVKTPPPTLPEKDWPDNDEALLELSADDGRTKLPENRWCLNDAFQGVQVFGGTRVRKIIR